MRHACSSCQIPVYHFAIAENMTADKCKRRDKRKSNLKKWFYVCWSTIASCPSANQQWTQSFWLLLLYVGNGMIRQIYSQLIFRRRIHMLCDMLRFQKGIETADDAIVQLTHILQYIRYYKILKNGKNFNKWWQQKRGQSTSNWCILKIEAEIEWTEKILSMKWRKCLLSNNALAKASNASFDRSSAQMHNNKTDAYMNEQWTGYASSWECLEFR